MAKKKQSLTLHQLLSALSFWGTAARGMLFGFLSVMTFLIALSEVSTSAAADNQFMILVYVLSSFLLLDIGYVMIARVYKIKGGFDMLALGVAEVMLGLLYIVPKVVVNPDTKLVVDPLTYVLFVPLIVLALRLLVGLLYGKR